MAVRSPKLGYAFNGEIVLDATNTPTTPRGLRQISAVAGTYCLRQSVIKVIPRRLVNAKVLQSNLVIRYALLLCE
jgi:hypothetical protein